MIRPPSSTDAVGLSVPIVVSCLAVFAVSLWPLAVAWRLVRPRGAAPLPRIAGAVALVVLVLILLGRGR